ncbi:MAG: hypothetical protein CVU77_06545 [Elusimicrobia bacterium HGW-Elusimicrobia-1]|jgi:hypothetical protein|nr:MAG: hypothetical protein CVU77_06545 [Elusimicrobia bacterium HGW-Elusimicrobia-1]
MDIKSGDFVLDRNKEILNIKKHGVDFHTAALAFKDATRKIFVDELHSKDETRLFCVGKVDGRPLTVRFIYRGGKIRIFGAGYWRKGAKYYEEND